VYPDFGELLSRLFGIQAWPWLSLIKSFGFLVAMGFLAGGYVIYLELKRKRNQGFIQDVIEEKLAPQPATPIQYVLSGILGAVIGYKILGMALNATIASPDPLAYIGSTQGSLLGAIIFAIAFVGLRFVDSKSIIDKQPVGTRLKVRTPAYMRVGDICMIAALFGFLGAKIFNAFETWDQFLKDPIGSLVSSSGLTFYGGLILATIALFYFAKKVKIPFKLLCDAAAPALILAYGIGRLGCQVSGDGDWGIHNSAYYTTMDGIAFPTNTLDSFNTNKVKYANYFEGNFQDVNKVPNKFVPRPAFLGFLPHWLFAYSYSHNVNNVGRPLPNCRTNYCNTLPVPVFPTPLYEFLACLLIFFILWKLRTRFDAPLTIFGIYLILNGVERFLVESIRVNVKIDYGFWHPTQAELIALCLIISGIFILVYNSIKKPMPTIVEQV
jgi:phosphatidylglycerol---prolipoprotein diacylglyceryl transferase